MRTRLALLAAVILGILAAIGVRMYVTQVDRAYEEKGKRMGIAVARMTLDRNHFLRDSDVREVEVDVQAITDDHIPYDQRRRYLGDKLTRKVPAGKPILKSYFLVEPEPGRTLDDEIDTRMRAMTIGTDQIAGVAGLLTPNCRVDILGTFRVPGRGPESAATVVTKTIARNVEVIAVDHRTDLRVPVRSGARGPALDYGYSSVTLHVTPLEASVLTFAQQSGKISFALRNSADQIVPPRRPPDITMSEFDDLAVEAAQERLQATGDRDATTPTPP